MTRFFSQHTWLFAILTVTLLTLRAGWKSSQAKERAIELMGSARWVVNFIIIIAFVTYFYYETRSDTTEESTRIKEALKKAIIAFLIAILAELRLTIAPFWLIFVLAYYLDNWT